MDITPQNPPWQQFLEENQRRLFNIFGYYNTDGSLFNFTNIPQRAVVRAQKIFSKILQNPDYDMSTLNDNTLTLATLMMLRELFCEYCVSGGRNARDPLVFAHNRSRFLRHIAILAHYMYGRYQDSDRAVRIYTENKMIHYANPWSKMPHKYRKNHALKHGKMRAIEPRALCIIIFEIRLPSGTPAPGFRTLKYTVECNTQGWSEGRPAPCSAITRNFTEIVGVGPDWTLDDTLRYMRVQRAAYGCDQDLQTTKQLTIEKLWLDGRIREATELRNKYDKVGPVVLRPYLDELFPDKDAAESCETPVALKN